MTKTVTISMRWTEGKSAHQGCQMVYFQTKNSNLSKF
jgi:hypothetical protein